MTKSNTESCPYRHTTDAPTSSSVQQKSAPTSPQEVLPTVTVSRSVSAAPPQLTQGWRNFARMRAQGPHHFFSEMAARTKQPFFKVQVGPQVLYQIADGEIAQELLIKQAKHLGRGGLLIPFKSMVGDVFFANDGQLASDTRKVFLNSVTRVLENFDRITQVTERTFASTKLVPGGGISDVFAFVAWHTMACISACFVGTDDLSAIPSDTHEIFLKATRQITQATMDPISRLIHPCLRSEFREASTAMASIAHRLLHSNLSNILKGNNYIWDLAVFRAQQIHPEMNFDNCTHFEADNPQAQIIRDLIENDRFVLEHGPLTIFASANVGATLFHLLDVLSYRPDIVESMRAEVTRVLGEQAFTYDRMAELPYVRAVVREALWQATPIPDFPREVLSPFKACINGETVSFKKGEMLMFLFRPMQGPERQFSPERWLGGDNNPAPTLFAFGEGPRRCPARPFAEQLLTQFLVNMTLHNLHIVLTRRPTYTTHNGNLGPDYQPQKPVTADIRPIMPEMNSRAVARL